LNHALQTLNGLFYKHAVQCLSPGEPGSYDRKMPAGRAKSTATSVENFATLDEILERFQIITESQRIIVG
jgi:hypothetical protein